MWIPPFWWNLCSVNSSTSRDLSLPNGWRDQEWRVGRKVSVSAVHQPFTRPRMIHRCCAQGWERARACGSLGQLRQFKPVELVEVNWSNRSNRFNWVNWFNWFCLSTGSTGSRGTHYFPTFHADALYLSSDAPFGRPLYPGCQLNLCHVSIIGYHSFALKQRSVQ